MKKVKSIAAKIASHTIWLSVILSFLINFTIEACARHGVLGSLIFLVKSPIVFFYNTLIILATMSIVALFRRRMFMFTMVSAIWLGLGIANGIILANRMTPFTIYDLQSLKDGLSLATNYMTKVQIAMLIAGGIILVVGIVLLWKKAPKKETGIDFKKDILGIIVIIAMTFGVSGALIKAKAVDTFFPNLAYGYRDNGFAYCFINTWLNTGVSKPVKYNAQNIKSAFTEKELKTTVGKTKGIVGKRKPNIIFIQLESLMDPLTVKGMKFSEDPIPNLRKLYKETSSGRITVPAMGAGTANTEFESMTGMSVKFFGPGEYPYKNIMLKTTAESIPYNLKQIGYKTHAIHNHRGVFYGRNRVFPNLGYDTFTSVEYMNNVGRTPKNWAKDMVLIDQVKNALKSTKEPDYVYAISVQGHGKYPTEKVILRPKVKVTKAPNESLKWQYEYYVNQIHEMDTFVKAFIDEMKKLNEDTVVVMYGDHLPALDNLTDDNLKDGRNTYQTDYFVWSNFKMEKQDKDLYCYQIGAELLKRLGIHNGTLTTYHQNHQKDKNYLQNLHDLQYDMLYGKRYIYDGKNPWKKLNTRMGIEDITLEKIVKIGDKYYIKGKNFTEYSKVNLNGKILNTEFLGPETLLLNEKGIKEDDIKKMKVSQVESKKEILSTTE